MIKVWYPCPLSTYYTLCPRVTVICGHCVCVLQLKGQCHEIFTPHFFHESTTPGPLMNRLKQFREIFRFRGDIREIFRFAEIFAKYFDFAEIFAKYFAFAEIFAKTACSYVTVIRGHSVRVLL